MRISLGLLLVTAAVLVSVPTAMAVTGGIDFVVVFSAFSSTDDDVKFRVPYPSDSATPNFYPSNVTGSYGPQLGVPNDGETSDVYNYYPIDEVNTYFKLLTFGKLYFSTVTYVQIQLTVPESEFGVGNGALTGAVAAVLDKVDDQFSYSSKYVLVVLPKMNTGDVDYVYSIYTSNVVVLNGYEHFLIKDFNSKFPSTLDLTNEPGLIGALGELFGLDPSDYEGYGSFADDSRGDDTDVMGTGGEESLAFTNPANLIKAGWLDKDTWAHRITRSGVYRVWPLRNDNLYKDYDFDLFFYDTSSLSDFYDTNPEKTPRVLIFDGLQSSGSSPDYYGWIRTETTYILSNVSDFERYTINFERELLIHESQFNVTKWINPSASGSFVNNAVKGAAGLRIGETFLNFTTTTNAVNAPCKITPTCRDTSTVPASILVTAECITALPNVVTGFKRQFSSDVNAEYQNDSFLIPPTTSTWTLTLSTARIQSFGGKGFFSFAYPGTGCSGAAAFKIDLDTSLNGESLILTSSWISSNLASRFAKGKAIALCWAEDVSQGNDDSFYTEQIYAPTVFLQPDDELFSTRCDLGCPFLLCTSPNITEGGCDCSGLADAKTPNTVCCFGNALSTTWNTGTRKPVCSTCTSSFSGTYCHIASSDYYSIDISPKQPFEGGELYFQGQIAVPPLPTSFPTLSLSNLVYVYLVCTATKSTGESIGEIARVPFSNDYTVVNSFYRFKIYNFEVISIQEDWAPFISVNCTLSADSGVLNYVSGYSTVFNISIEETASLQAPYNIRVVQYGNTGNVTLGWDEPDAVEFLSNVTYFVDYRVLGDSAWTRAPQTTSSRITLDLVENVDYEATVTLTHSESGTITSDIFYFRTLDIATSCTTEQVPTCSISNCNSTYGYCQNDKCHCQGYFHGPDCSVSGCKQTASSPICSGQGVCTSLTAKEGFCTCNEFFYGMFCEKVDWSTFSIQIENPGELFAGTNKEITWPEVPYDSPKGFKFFQRYAAPGETLSQKEFDSGTEISGNSIVVSIPTTNHDFDESGQAQFKVIDLSWPGVYGTITVTTTRPAPSTTLPPTSDTPTGDGSDKTFLQKMFDEYLGYTIGIIIGVAILLLASTAGTCFILRRRRIGPKAVIPSSPGVEIPGTV